MPRVTDDELPRVYADLRGRLMKMTLLEIQRFRNALTLKRLRFSLAERSDDAARAQKAINLCKMELDSRVR